MNCTPLLSKIGKILHDSLSQATNTLQREPEAFGGSTLCTEEKLITIPMFTSVDPSPVSQKLPVKLCRQLPWERQKRRKRRRKQEKYRNKETLEEADKGNGDILGTGMLL